MIIFIPSDIPPHKGTGNLARANDRYQMLKEAIVAYEQFDVSDVEIKRQGRSYTIDTVKHFKREYPPETQIYLIVIKAIQGVMDTTER